MTEYEIGNLNDVRLFEVDAKDIRTTDGRQCVLIGETILPLVGDINVLITELNLHLERMFKEQKKTGEPYKFEVHIFHFNRKFSFLVDDIPLRTFLGGQIRILLEQLQDKNTVIEVELDESDNKK